MSKQDYLFIWVQYDKQGDYQPHMTFMRYEKDDADFEINDLKSQGHRAKYGNDFREAIQNRHA